MLTAPFASREAQLADAVYVSVTGDDSNPGTSERPLRGLETGLARLRPGSVLVLLDGTWALTAPFRVRARGTPGAWIEIRGAPGATPILDAAGVDIPWAKGYPSVQGAVQIEEAAFVRLRNVHVKNSHLAGFNVVESQHVDLVNCSSSGSFASGISAWKGVSDLRVLGNIVTGANESSRSFEPLSDGEGPHEAISIAGVQGFEVAWNDVFANEKEGIDVKETSAHGVVHHNVSRDNARQGLYVDGWFGVLEDIELHDNVVHGNEAGIAISSEDGVETRNIRVHHNLVFENRASGIYFSRWGKDNLREAIVVDHNTFYRNGRGPKGSGDPDYWLSGGCYLHSTRLRSVAIRDNVFAQNMPFEIGYSNDYGTSGITGQITIEHNLIQDLNATRFPLWMGTWAKDSVSSTPGDHAVIGDPLFVNPTLQDFRPRPGSPATGMGALEPDASARFWWAEGFPPLWPG